MAENTIKVYNANEIRRIAPGYHGKSQNFDPAKVGKKISKPPQRNSMQNVIRKRAFKFTNQIYEGYRVEEKQFERVLVYEEMVHYAMSMLHLKFTEIKAKQGEQL
ncbi:hypothetical protein ABEB36_014289 [Hypothenemus hampei]|uniref:Uncharacterized protein n=1 Tax=Hypothenemus hampei TaxID=57062 RepID=A0ABD1E3X2_HYPHA